MGLLTALTWPETSISSHSPHKEQDKISFLEQREAASSQHVLTAPSLERVVLPLTAQVKSTPVLSAGIRRQSMAADEACLCTGRSAAQLGGWDDVHTEDSRSAAGCRRPAEQGALTSAMIDEALWRPQTSNRSQER